MSLMEGLEDFEIENQLAMIEAMGEENARITLVDRDFFNDFEDDFDDDDLA
eukprot:CAMPEP_0174261894 /NCGR_PEP_ID=MMETSP0439-20130205/12625_1 /TAXON_ID=0 /ORGANISM="Stereomyxa ramosa, Strain Chinc5" /LENGTH=50 /DNA_ID=CAMNT_0015346499 /DNA_START=94 /DNA_END=246 /DNA_ORIENTATION=-